ncbi:DNA cytosine methyltransferase [Brevibacillus agri]|uniref:DNA cytosine methyltransferase n=1 Tax=Brevibacillus agri TaxID=51101 RepID=UPI001EE5B0FC|nr:DNA cytosine methyltransferase [Brevibacillus agri]MCG5254530.1 DNA cytosine methyltransferase [Brevibacillus agri]MED1641977.1 DNA cytosine methyltransferase [Brevibacillus agri]MED1657801.1 DNA cytosine methyltransferase [Brevibacillus agri]MED1689761.1 DNA cytosine methyltransferase [Brevibacillus agri]MED1695278.1 DNA cytosine methyltransferase [Brevibacillus agri]
MRALELFAGAGGLALGTEKAGFEHVAVAEWNADACSTLRRNRPHWNIIQGDVRQLNYSDIGSNIDLVTGGPPCQPFSLGGRHKAWNDERDMFPEAIRAVREIRPRAFLFENVRGLARQSFSTYIEYIILQLTYPSLLRKTNESWQEHLSRLEQHHTGTGGNNPEYKVIPPRVLNAADYGVPQRRDRIFFVGFRADVNAKWSFPEPTHSQYALQVSKWVTGDYWRERNILPTQPTPSSKVIAQLSQISIDSLLTPWVTLRDAINDLPDPRLNTGISNHVYQPGARPYPGHTGSLLDEPSKTLKAGDHGVPGGENMIAFPDGTYRYLTIRESARVQTFPDDYTFEGSWSEAMRQIGNAVPVELAARITKHIYDALILAEPQKLYLKRCV